MLQKNAKDMIKKMEKMMKKMANYYLLQLVRVLQHMPCVSTLNKWR